MKASAVWLLGVVLVPCMALAQAPAANLNTITSVQVNGGTVTISGSKKANFTTFTMTDPPRLVIDIAEAVFNGVPEETQVGNGTVTGIRTASYGSDDSAIARVLIGFEREVETDIQATDSQLVIKVVGGAGQAVAQAAPTQPAAQPATDGSAAEAAADERRATAQAAADEKKRQQEDARAAAKTAAEEKRAAAQAAKEEAAEARRQREEEARAERERRQQERVAMAQPRERREVSSGGSSEVSSRRKTMTLVGFQQQGGVSRVFIRTNEPVRYSVSETGNAVVLELENSRIDLSNNTRPLDTSYFNSPVTRVDADAEGRNVRVTVQLRQQAPVQAQQDGNVISLDFQRTAR
ncbi:hypothetical protein MFUL124B02_16990 [Myxococcus fulvus 124B02]|nr:hypothetical protein MFUL124B02_16990 [Myxococcus fulvus 124B02]